MDTGKLRNDKYFSGKFNSFKKTKGWFVGSFFDEGHPCKTDKLETLYREHKKGDICKPHYHSQKVELIIMLDGKARYNVNDKDVMLDSGDFLFIDINNIVTGEYLEDSKTFSIHSPSIPTDKTLV